MTGNLEAPPATDSHRARLPTAPSKLQRDPAASSASAMQTAVDPVCHMDVVMIPTSLHAEVDDATWWFCCQGCLDRFVADPAAFARA